MASRFSSARETGVSDTRRTTRAEAMRRYMAVAAASRKTAVPKRKSSDVSQILEGQVQISVGRMMYSACHQRGKLDRSWKLHKLSFHKNLSYQAVKKICQEATWPDEEEGTTYYLADGSGVSIEQDNFELVSEDGKKNTIAWTLANYLEISHIKYPSRTRLYCVKVSKEDAENVQDDASEKDSSKVDASEPEQQELQPQPQDNEPSPFDSHEGFFQVYFVEKTASRYSNRFAFRHGLTQEEILCWRLLDDPDTMMKYRDTVASSPGGQYRVLDQNPIHLGFFLSTIEQGGKEVCDLIDTVSCESGEVAYKSPCEGTKLEIWCGCYASQADRRACMACVALGGNHSRSAYHWKRNGEPVFEESPLLYADSEGTYECQVTSAREECSGVFRIDGTRSGIRVELVKDDPMDVEVTQERNVSVHMQSLRTEPEGTSGTQVSKITEVDSQLVADSACQDTLVSANLSELKRSLQTGEGCQALKLLDVLGSGSFGRVYRGVWRGTMVAAKVIPMPKTDRRVWENEIAVYRTLNHPNILALLGVVSDTTSITLITNLVNGKDLHSLIFNNDKDISFSTKIWIIVQVCQALVFMHTATPPVIHLDLKPANILVENKTMHIFWADFGLSRILSDCDLVGSTTMRAGTPGFQAPEQLQGKGISPKSDVYALGGVITEVFGEKVLWPKMPAHRIMFRVAVEGVFPSTKHLPQVIQEVTSLCFIGSEARADAATVLAKVLDMCCDKKSLMSYNSTA